MRIALCFRRLLPVFAAVCALGAFLPRVHADAAADARKMIQVATDREDAALQKKDLQNAFAACAPDFRASDGKGHFATVAQLKEQMQALFGSALTIKAKNTIQKIALKGSQAVVTMASHTELTVPGLTQSGKGALWIRRMSKSGSRAAAHGCVKAPSCFRKSWSKTANRLRDSESFHR